jgi:hypothetical protein
MLQERLGWLVWEWGSEDGMTEIGIGKWVVMVAAEGTLVVVRLMWLNVSPPL